MLPQMGGIMAVTLHNDPQIDKAMQCMAALNTLQEMYRMLVRLKVLPDEGKEPTYGQLCSALESNKLGDHLFDAVDKHSSLKPIYMMLHAILPEITAKQFHILNDAKYTSAYSAVRVGEKASKFKDAYAGYEASLPKKDGNKAGHVL